MKAFLLNGARVFVKAAYEIALTCGVVIAGAGILTGFFLGHAWLIEHAPIVCGVFVLFELYLFACVCAAMKEIK